MVSKDHKLSVRRQCALLTLARSNLYYEPKGESAENRAIRLRQYEDFFNVTGMGTADDLEEFRACQEGYGAASSAPWNDLSRGAPLWIKGPDENAKKLGINPLLSGERSEDEGLFVCQHDYWLSAMKDALAKEKEQLAEAKSANNVA